jgi:hypothetical protein
MLQSHADRIHFLLYEDIVCGKYRPFLQRYSSREILESLIFEANTHKIATIGKNENADTYLEDDYTQVGFKEVGDYELVVKELANGKKEIILKPLQTYELREVMDIPQFPSFKCNCFMALMGDEFERLKIRAGKILDTCNDIAVLKTYASKHVQKAKKLYYDAKLLLKELQEKKNQDDVYIIFALNLFIIRTILFFQKLFRPYLKTREETEEQLMSELIKEITWRKLYSLFRCSGKGYCEYLKKTYTDKPDVLESHVHELHEDQGKSFYGKQTQPYSQEFRAFKKIKINCNLNVLVDMYLQMLDVIKVEGKLVMETSLDNLEVFLLHTYIDKDGKDINPLTLKTYLKPYRDDKHLKGKSKRRIDLSPFFKDEE